MRRIGITLALASLLMLPGLGQATGGQTVYTSSDGSEAAARGVRRDIVAFAVRTNHPTRYSVTLACSAVARGGVALTTNITRCTFTSFGGGTVNALHVAQPGNVAVAAGTGTVAGTLASGTWQFCMGVKVRFNNGTTLVRDDCNTPYIFVVYYR
jgi:hypothetical protein